MQQDAPGAQHEVAAATRFTIPFPASFFLPGAQQADASTQQAALGAQQLALGAVVGAATAEAATRRGTAIKPPRNLMRCILFS
ncbi:MAG: hypothetical protein H7Z41_11255 [Cytophagales bacterium]|nr:hypothetical protein [Armatimonadota bacterium]